MPSGALLPAIRINSGVYAFLPVGCECRNTVTTACSASRPGRRAGDSRWIWRAFSSSASSSVLQSVWLPSTVPDVATPASSRTASEIPDLSGAANRADGPISGAVSHRSASRSAVASVRRIPRVRWNPSSWVQRL